MFTNRPETRLSKCDLEPMHTIICCYYSNTVFYKKTEEYEYRKTELKRQWNYNGYEHEGRVENTPFTHKDTVATQKHTKSWFINPEETGFPNKGNLSKLVQQQHVTARRYQTLEPMGKLEEETDGIKSSWCRRALPLLNRNRQIQI